MNSVKEFPRRVLPLLICTLLICTLVFSSQPVGAQQPSPPRQDKVAAPTPSPQASRTPAVAPAPQPQSSPITSPQSSPNTVRQGSPAAAVAANPASDKAEFAELLAGENYVMVGEISGINEVVNSNMVADALAPFERLGEVPKEVFALREFVTRHAETLETTRISFAAQPMRPGLPQVLIRIQCVDTEAARKLEAPLRNLLRTLFASVAMPNIKQANEKDAPPNAKQPEAAAKAKTVTTNKPATEAREASVKASSAASSADVTGYKIKLSARSIFVSDAEFKVADLRAPATEASLAESTRYNKVHTRFAADPLFIFYDLKLLERSLEDAMQKQRAIMEQAEKEQAEKEQPEKPRVASGEEAAPTAPETEVTDSLNDENDIGTVEMTESAEPVIVSVDSSPGESAANNEGTDVERSSRGAGTQLLDILLPSLFSGGGSDFTNLLGGAEALGIGVNLNAEAVSVRTLLATPEKNYVSPIPFFPQVVAGAPNSSRAASLLPADTEVYVSTSLDFPKSFDKFLEATEKRVQATSPPQRRVTNGVVEAADTQPEAPEVNAAALYVAGIEAQLNFKIKDDLLATLGSEFAFGLLPPVPAPSPDERKSTDAKESSGELSATDEVQSKEGVATVNATSEAYGFVGLISVADKARLQALLPKVAELFGIKPPGVTAANLFERRGDIEYLRFAPGVAAAFIGDFLVVASDDAALQRIVATTQGDRSLAGDNSFVAGREWQPRDRLAELYVRGGATDKLFGDDRRWIASVVGDIEPFFNDFTQNQAPLTLALSGEVEGSLHEIRIPRSLIVSTLAHAAADAKHGEKVRNERSVTYRLQSIAGAQESFHKKNTRYGSLEELRKADLYNYSDDDEPGGYRITIKASASDFNATAEPTQYGVTGRRSYYIDQTGTLRAGDHGGKAAEATDPVVK
jgi:hypothetical protein